MTTQIQTLELFIQNGFISSGGSCTLNGRHVTTKMDLAYICLCEGTVCSECIFNTFNRQTIHEVLKDGIIKTL